MTWDQLYVVPWVVLGAWWAVRAFGASRAVQREPFYSRLPYVLALVAGVYLIAKGAAGTRLDERLWPRSFAVAVAGLLLECLGVGFAIWARETLGTLWSGAVTLKAEHRIIRSGPYGVTRHPIYTGALTALTGAAFAQATPGAFLGVVLTVGALLWKIRLEERLLEGHFGEEYRDYRRHVRALIPFIL
jgi:protein-S-isoprenylcysteine O-methyltransferase Ste14